MKRSLPLNDYLRKKLRYHNLGLPILLATVVTVIITLTYLVQLYDENRNLAKALSAHAASLVETGDVTELQRLLASVTETTGIKLDVVSDGKTIASSRDVSTVGKAYLDNSFEVPLMGIWFHHGHLSSKVKAKRGFGPDTNSYIVVERHILEVAVLALLVALITFVTSFGVSRLVIGKVIDDTANAVAPVAKLSEAVKKLSRFGKEEFSTDFEIKELNDLRDTILSTQSSLTEANEKVAIEKAKAMAGEAYRSFIHDQSTPLAAMRGWLKIAVDKSQPPEVREEAFDRMFDLSEQLIRQAGAARNNLTIEVSPTEYLDIRGTVNTVVTDLELAKSLEERNVKIETEQSDAAQFVKHDSIMLGRAISNLVSNAVDASRSLVKVSTRKSQGKFSVTVEDDGPGLSEEDAGLFLQGRGRSTKSDRKGMGLSIARHIVRAHGGKISYKRSENLKGASFKIEWGAV